ncbi:hypothetical protein DCC62_23325 [candidate division KSB1 bacterium]|nr:MAG: hypothetical protein DCC62_23325 [candidate division KSB1 bacterium]
MRRSRRTINAGSPISRCQPDRPCRKTSSAPRAKKSTPVLKQFAELLKADATLSFSIECHDNELPSEGDNVRLSQARAEALKEHLVREYKISEEQLSTKGWGETRPLADANTVEARKVNQRVEFIRK